MSNPDSKMLLLLLLLIPVVSFGASQDPLTGRWTGNFMGDFKTVVSFNRSDDGQVQGTIRMFSGPQLIQDDPLEGISLEGSLLRFSIPAKETSFSGTLESEGEVLRGSFLFPDGSEHPLELARSGPGIPGIPPGNDQSAEDALGISSVSLSPEEMEEDLRFLMESLRNVHPRPFAYTSEAEFDVLMEQLLNLLKEPMDLESFYRTIAPLTDAVRCSHTGIRLPEQYARHLSIQEKFLPVRILCVAGHMEYVSAADHSAADILPGTRIQSINGIPADSILEALCPMIPSEGDQMTPKWYRLSREFSWYYRMLDPSDRYLVEFTKDPAPPVTRTFDARTLEQQMQGPQAPPPAVPLSFEDAEGVEAKILTVPTFEVRDMEGYMGALGNLFGQLRTEKVPCLILDLRGNQGGHPIFAAQLLSYLVPDGFTYFRENPDIKEFEPLYRPMSPDPLAFRGDLFVLVDGGCLSTTGHLLSLIQEHTGARFVGELPGSFNRCNDFSLQVSLPNSGIEANIPRTTFETAISDTGEPPLLRVTYPVSPVAGDIASGTDSALAACLKAIEELQAME